MTDLDDERQWLTKVNETATTFMDKKMILDARDKLIRLKQERPTDLATAVALVGTCPDMCPEQERYFRIETNCVSTFELDSNGSPDQTRMVKEYRRSGADQKEPLPHELRPIAVLQRTMTYLCLEIIDMNIETMKAGIGEWFDFVWSRTRSIRKDITQQHLINLDSVSLIEKCARFHIYCAYYLCEEEVKDFDPKINQENLHNCLQTLKEFYFDLGTRSIYCPNEAEIRSYDILLNLRNGETLSELKHYRKCIRDSGEIRFAVKVYQAFHGKNYIKFFQLARRANFFMSCILNNYFNQFRIDLLNIMRRAYTIPKSKNPALYPITDIIQHFAFDDFEELSHFCDLIDLKYDNESIHLQRSMTVFAANVKHRSHLLVQSKLTTTPGQAILSDSNRISVAAQILPIHSSFDKNNRLVFDINASLTTPVTVAATNKTANQEIISKKDFIPPNTMQKAYFSKNENLDFSFVNQVVKIAKPAAANDSTFGSVTSAETKNVPSTTFSFSFPKNISAENASNDVNSTFKFNLENNTITPIENKNFFSLKPDTAPLPPQTTSTKEIFSHNLPHIDPPVSKLQVNEHIFGELIADVTRKECNAVMERQAIVAAESNQYLDELIGPMVLEQAAETLQAAKRWQQAVREVAQQELDKLLHDLATSTIEEIYRTAGERHRRQALASLVDEAFDELLRGVLTQLAEQVVAAKAESRRAQIAEWRQHFLRRKYYARWHSIYVARKKFRFYRDSFPAAPIRHECAASSGVGGALSAADRTVIDQSYIKAYSSLKRKMIYSRYKNFADINNYGQKWNHRSDGVTNDAHTAASASPPPLDRLKREHYLRAKYFKLWLRNVRICKRHFIRSQFPAAPIVSSKPKLAADSFASNRLTVIDSPVRRASQSVKRNLLQKLNYDFDSTVRLVKRKLEERERVRYSSPTTTITELQPPLPLLTMFSHPSVVCDTRKRFVPFCHPTTSGGDDRK